MQGTKTLEFLRFVVAGGIVGTAIAGAFFGGLDATLFGLDLNEAGALLGAAASAVLVKAIHLV
jgi:hypothetical protein